MTDFTKGSFVKDYIRIENCLYNRETQKAYLLSIEGNDYWVPKSQLKPGTTIIQFGRGPIEVSKWWFDTNFTNNSQSHSQSHSHAHSGSIHSDPAGLEIASKIYRKLVSKYHPDRSPESAEVMTDINELWNAIKAAIK